MPMRRASEISAPQEPAERTPAYYLYGPDSPVGPVVISVPHAGRDYTPELLSAARVPQATLRRLEDRFADYLVHRLIERGQTVVVAKVPRAAIDLNRSEREIDPAMIRGLPRDQSLTSSAKLRGGLGLVPRRLQGAGDLWREAVEWSDLSARIEAFHRPYHAVLERLLSRALEEHGHAILLDIHSMPPLPPAAGLTPRIVLGDRFGRSASSRLTFLATDLCVARGVPAAQNHPYPGNYLLERHGMPERRTHALQLEVDRSLYLDSALDRPGPGLAAMQGLIADLVDALGIEMPRTEFAQAAE